MDTGVIYEISVCDFRTALGLRFSDGFLPSAFVPTPLISAQDLCTSPGETVPSSYC